MKAVIYLNKWHASLFHVILAVNNDEIDSILASQVCTGRSPPCITAVAAATRGGRGGCPRQQRTRPQRTLGRDRTHGLLADPQLNLAALSGQLRRQEQLMDVRPHP